MNMIDDFIVDVKASGPILRMSLLGFGALMLLISVLVGIFYFSTGKGSPPSGAMDAQRIPGQTYTVGFIEVFQCLREGPRVCNEYEGAQEFLIASMSKDGIEYQPLRPGDPGQATEDGLKRFTPSTATPVREWKAFSAAVTLDGIVATSVVSEDDVIVETDSDVARFPINTPKGTLEGQMTLGSTNEGTLFIEKVVYVPATPGGDGE